MPGYQQWNVPRRSSFKTCVRTGAASAPRLGPTPLLFLDHPFADHLVHRRFQKRRRDRFVVAIPIPVVGDEGPVDLDVVMKFTHGLEQLLHTLRSIDTRVEVTLQILSKAPREKKVNAPPPKGVGFGVQKDQVQFESRPKDPPGGLKLFQVNAISLQLRLHSNSSEADHMTNVPGSIR